MRPAHVPDARSPLARREAPTLADSCSLTDLSLRSPSPSLSSHRFRKWTLLCEVIAVFLSLLCGYPLGAGIRLKLLLDQVCLYQNRKRNSSCFEPCEVCEKWLVDFFSNVQWLLPIGKIFFKESIPDEITNITTDTTIQRKMHGYLNRL